MGGRQDCFCAIDDKTRKVCEKEMRGICGMKLKKGGQMIKHSRWKECEGV